MSGEEAAPIATGEIVAALESMLRAHRGMETRVIALERRPSPYRSSFALEELTVHTPGATIHLVFKDVGWHALSGAAQGAKPAFLHDPEREILVYQRILAGVPGPPACIGTVRDLDRSRFWLFLEHIDGLRLTDHGAGPVWHDAVRWLARFHTACDDRATALATPVLSHLITYDERYYRRWGERAATIATARLARDTDRRTLAHVLDGHRAAIPRLLNLPRTVIHGECYATNVLVDATDHGRICLIDWELAGYGPGIMDLAAISAGSWNRVERAALARSYYEALSPDARQRPDWQGVLRALDDCRLHLAVQWLGWSDTWTPPSGQQQDWLAVAAEIVGEGNP